ncbi:MAG: hypothetical protein HYR83_14520 [Planctomycetes bacterium]|nr:hypothetical protein [Planctomycetota bacterium]
MNQHDEMNDGEFDDYLSTQGSEWISTMKMNPELREKCLAAMDAGRAQGRRLRDWGRRTLVSTMGLAAAIALIVTFAFPPNGNTPVAAKTVLAKLAEQVQGEGVLQITLDAIRVEGASIEGRVQIAEDSAAGDVHLTVKEDGDDLPIDIDASFAVSPSRGWILLRHLQVPDPQAQAFIQLFVSAESPTLIILPPTILTKLEIKPDTPISEIRRMASGEIADIVREILNSQADLGAVTKPQPDGTMRTTLRVKNVEVLRKLVAVATAATGKQMDGEMDISENDAKEILGCTLGVTYEPQTQAVRSFSISDIAEMKGTITIALQDGSMNPAMLDPARVTTPNTRTIDAGFLKTMFDAAGKK